MPSTLPESADPTWKETHHELVSLMRADNVTNIKYVLFDYVLLALTLTGCILGLRAWEQGTLLTAEFVPLALLGMLVIAAVQHRLSGLGHEAGHYVMFKNPWANELASDFLCMFPILAMTQQFRATHLGHHRFVNDPERDPDVVRLNQPFPLHWPMSKVKFWLRFVVGAIWPPYLLGYLWGQAKNANFVGGPEMRGVYNRRVGAAMRAVYWLGLLSVVYATGSWRVLVWFWFVPLLTFYPFMMQLREIAHHSNAPDDDDLTNSRIFDVNPLVSGSVFPYGQAFHVTHHMFAMLPHYRIAEAHEVLMRYRPYRENVVICRGYFFPRWGTHGPTVLDELSREHEAVPAAA
ncbi:MAG: fatty acid desaturase [Pirellulales bacterium]